MKLKSILYILMLLPFLWSCNNEDDVEEIFASGTWHVVDFYGKANWDKRNGEPKYNAMAHNPDKTIATEGRKALDIIHGFNITFKADGTFTGSIQNGTIEGTLPSRTIPSLRIRSSSIFIVQQFLQPDLFHAHAFAAHISLFISLSIPDALSFGKRFS